MTKLYMCKAEGVYDYLGEIIFKTAGEKREICRTENGKPYIEGNPFYFSISHSGTRAAIAVDDKPVGVDLEIFKNKDHLTLINRFSEREREEIFDERSFLFHWTAREAFIKMKGATLAEYLKRLEYCGGRIFLDGTAQNCNICAYVLGYGIVSVCTEK